MKMRLNFVRSLLHRPEIMFLDEPTTGLDPVNGKIIKDILLQKKREGKTIFLTTPDWYSVTTVIIMASLITGKLLARGATKPISRCH